MTNEVELLIQQQLLQIIKKLDDMGGKIDRLLVSEQPKQECCEISTDADQISEDVRAKLSEALVRKRARAVAEMNKKQ
ncbi:MAG: hypothetical protein RW306_12705 [Geobacteraceae bacterium]|nr:hypothetical protein [Geobacteraceae bacterium]